MKLISFLKVFLFIIFVIGISGFSKIDLDEFVLKVSINNLAVDGSDVYLKLCFKNTGTKEAYIEKLNFPFEGILARDLFAIKKNNDSNSYVSYIGKVAERGRLLDESDFIKIDSGESMEINVKLSEFYDFSEKNVTYSVMYDSENKVIGDSKRFEIIKSNTLTLELNGDSPNL